MYELLPLISSLLQHVLKQLGHLRRLLVFRPMNPVLVQIGLVADHPHDLQQLPKVDPPQLLLPPFILPRISDILRVDRLTLSQKLLEPLLMLLLDPEDPKQSITRNLFQLVLNPLPQKSSPIFIQPLPLLDPTNVQIVLPLEIMVNHLIDHIQKDLQPQISSLQCIDTGQF